MARSTNGAAGLTMPGAGLASAVVRVFGDLRFHTDGEILALAFAGDDTLCSVEEPGVLRQWDPASGRQNRWQYLSDLETLWEFGPAARLLASASDDLSLWDVATAQATTVLAQPCWVTAVALGVGRLAVTGHDDGVARLWDTAGQRVVREFTGGHTGALSAAALSDDGKRLATAGEDRLICLWDVQTGRLAGTLAGHTDRIERVGWLPDGRLASTAWDTTARLWDTVRCEPIILLNSHADQVTAMALSAKGDLLACADSGGAVRIWDLATLKERHVLVGHKDAVHALAFRGDGTQLASGGAERMIYLWDVREGRLLSGTGETVLERTSVAVSPDGTRLASTCGGTGLRVWEVATGRAVEGPQHERNLQALAASPDGQWLAAGGVDGTVEVWRADGKAHQVLQGQKQEVTALAFAPDAKQLASASSTDGTVWLWNVADGRPVLVIPEAADNCVVESVAFHPSGNLLAAGGVDWLATGGSDGAIGLWDLAARKNIATFDGGTTSVAFHPGGKRLAAASLVRSVCVWDLEQQDLEIELTSPDAAFTCVAYSPDGRWLAAGGDDHSLHVWDADTHELVGSCELDTQVKALCFSPDSRRLYTGNGNCTNYEVDVGRLQKADLG